MNHAVSAGPHFHAYLVSRGRMWGEAGIGLILTDGTTTRTFSGFGYATDGEYPRFHAAHHIFYRVLPPDATLTIHSVGLEDRLRHYSLSLRGRKSDGSPFIGEEFLGPLAAAREEGLLSIKKPSPATKPHMKAAKEIAETALREELRIPGFPETVVAERKANAILIFREVQPS
ncbi:hypothetical protein MRS76_03230 [Rhizobiaceae bacterium n13]|uniref:Uncharacterized protein n=1 Tax=Ferirhizobium litorale TaxID=2927786 RepID=A0AAE3QA58_9HYPH|nr:hypothetical protein [Fererhizobium litorale]MDI7860958.1 hypothetical protein [Fererhizobium litorale]MDI7921106.1 hypothetical protein [Fererhizobium litorale]